MYSLIADLVLLLHFAFIVFVVGGEIIVIVGFYRNWLWVRNLRFRIFHVLAIGFVVVQGWINQVCPLTIWESALRHAAGEESYLGTFIGHWVGQLVFYDAPQWVFVTAYSMFGALVLFTWFWIRPEPVNRESTCEDN
jgi:hypothetical protein